MHGAALAYRARAGWQRVVRSPLFWLAAAAPLAALSVQSVLAATGGKLAVPLDDAYIHFQFARSLARGTPFVYSPGTEPVPGATSLLWPLLLSITEFGGSTGSATIVWAFCLAWAALGLLAYEATRAAEGLLSDGMAPIAGLCVLALSANAWFATSGMEVVPLAWVLMRSARRAAEWLEGNRRHRLELIALAFVAPALRPEGALATALIAGALFWTERGRARLFALLALAGALFPSLVCYLGTGEATQTTARAKWILFSPYLTRDFLWDAIGSNVSIFFGTLLGGRIWSSVFIPEHARLIGILALPALAGAGVLRRSGPRAGLLIALGLGIFLPATYDCMLCNRLRYLWPFATPWLLGASAFADQLGSLAARVQLKLGALRFLLGLVLVAALAQKLPIALQDLGESALAISQQHVALGEWARRALPKAARIGVNDTGAIAYFSERTTFDVVGLTTKREARYWAAGAGSRFEHYERLGARRLPTHLIVYPNWFAIPELIGECLTERTVHATILGGETMLACRADYTLLGSGERPMDPAFRGSIPLDSVDVADLESEQEHDYLVLPAVQADNVVVSDGVAVDGARTQRTRDCFEIWLAPGAEVVARLGAENPSALALRVDDRVVGRWTLARGEFEEPRLRLPSTISAGRHQLCVEVEQGFFSAAHYWAFAAGR
jgi:hypothetical protein